MTWSDFVKRGLLQPQKFNERALAELWAVVERDLKDSKVEQLSNDRKFATAYSAALNVARISVAMAGYRILAKAGHHRTTFEAATVALGDDGASICD